MVLVLVPLSQVMVTSQFPNSGDGRNDIQVEGRLSRKAEAARVPVVGGVGEGAAFEEERRVLGMVRGGLGQKLGDVHGPIFR